MSTLAMSFRLAAAAAAAAPALGCALAGQWPLALAFVTVGAGWQIADRRPTGDRAAMLGMAACTIGIALAARLGVEFGWLLAGMLAALAAWDLQRFRQRLDGAVRPQDAPALVQGHLRQLLLALALGLLLSGGALLVHLRLTFGQAVLMALLAVLALIAALRQLRQTV